ncbi:hypothetical protein PHYPSEUDO_004890 [Phytophthora pseudosyringae]|uniref:Transmembrane protein n=1 Tax=Phytophthora pseudosyringae TaxID=221518 RepID=A0A8T1VQF4_9STRA|nr:hypothetical protein PHYPSEUDO_004890 [Phytophthora pseudosyringae]
MRTSGGAGATFRRLRSATPGPLHSSTTLLLALVLLCSLVAAESASQPAQQRREWSPHVPLERHVTVGADGIATSRGAGRRRSDGLSITRSIPVETGIAPDAAVDDQAIKFTPARVDLGRLETCSPQRYHVGVENRGRVSVRLDGADFSQEGFSFANDVRGIRLDPGDRFTVQFVFLPRDVQPNGVDAHLRVLTTSGLFSLPISSPEVVLNRYGVRAIRASVPVGVRFGQSVQFANPWDYTIRITEMYALDSFVHLELLNGSNWIGPRWPREGDDNEVGEIPGEYDPQFDYDRRAGRGAWDMPAGTTSPLMRVSLQSNTSPGVHFTYIHIAAGERRLLMVPVRITVLKPGIHIEPKELNLGVLADLHDDEHLETTFTLYNAGVNPIEILELKVLESNLRVSAQLWGGSSVIPPRTQVLNALTVQIRVDNDTTGACFASLMLKTNASSSELGQRKLKLYGRVVHGNVSFRLNETRFGVTMPLENVFNGGEGAHDAGNENDDEQAVEDQEIPTTKLVSIIGENASIGIMAGTTAIRKLRLWNQFDCAVELQRAWVESELVDQEEVSVYRFKQGIVPAGSAWPKISLQIAPTLQRKTEFFATRSYSLMVETNVSLHRITINVYHGFLIANSTSSLQNYSVSGYYSDAHARELNSSQSCFVVPKGGLVTTSSPRIDGGEGSTDTQAVQMCRSLLFDLEKVASHRPRTEVVKITNENPVPVTLKITNMSGDESVDMSISAAVSLAHLDDLPDASVSGRTMYWNNELGRNSTSNNTIAVLAGDSFVLQSGNQVEFSVKIQAKDKLGELTVPVMTVETPIEVFHLFARLRSVQGTVEPVTPTIVLPAMFPGRTQIIHLQYRNTFEHTVTPLMTTISNSNLKLVSMRGVLAPKQVESVLELVFSPAEGSKCSDAIFLADCLLPLSDAVDEQTCEQLSDYGEFVDQRDLNALSRRDAFWSRTQGPEHQSTVEAQVLLQTDIMEDVAEVTIKAFLERPLVTSSAAASLYSNRSTNVFKRKEFALTEVFHQSHVFVNVRNPSNISIQMELTIAEADQNLFYFCDEELKWNEGSAVNMNRAIEDNSEGISPMCLTEWEIAIANAVAQQREKHVDIDVPPFYFRRNIIRVPAGEEAQLGPIYYLPSKVQEVATIVFVRNGLSHIEPVPLLARSGKGTLGLMVDTSADSGKSRFVGEERIGDAGEDNSAEDDTLFRCDGTLSFALTQDDAATEYTQGAEILLSNAGPFGLVIRSVRVEEPGDSSWMMPSWASNTASQTSDFLVTLEHLTVENSESRQVVLPPGTTARYRVSFCASCFAASVASWLIIDTSDSIKRIRLQGTVTTDAAFSCLRSRMAPLLRNACHYAWIMAAAVTLISTLYTMFILAYDAWTHGAVHEIQALNLAVDTEDTSTEMAVLESHEVVTTSNMAKTSPRTLASIGRLLEEMEQATFAPSARIVTPAVSELLAQRHKGLCSSVRSSRPSGIVLVNEAGEKSSLNDPAWPSPATERGSPSDEAPTATETSVLDVQKGTVNEAGSADGCASLPSTNAPQPYRAATNASGKLHEGSGDHKDSGSSAEESSSEAPEDLLSSASSSRSTIAQPDAEEFSREVDFPKLSFGSPGDQLQPGTGSSQPAAPTGPTSAKQEEGPFEAFKSLSARWRAEDWHDSLNDPSQPGNFLGMEGWNGTLSLNTLLGSTAGGNHRDENVRSGSRSESSSFIGTGPGLYLDGFSAFAPPAAALSAGTTPKASAKKAPPGFTPADAKPIETRAAFEQLRSSSGATPSAPTVTNSSDGFGGNSLFASKLPLFGPALPPDRRVTLGGVGRIGSGRSRVLRDLGAPTK